MPTLTWTLRSTRTDPDAGLVQRMAAGDEQALVALYDRHASSLLAYLARRVRERQLAEELLDDVMLASWEAAAAYRGQASVRTWLFTIAHNKALNAVRREPRPGTIVALLAALDQITVAPQTRIQLGVRAAEDALTGPRHHPGIARAIIVLTDGRANPDSPELAVDAAAQAKAAGITVFTVGLGAELDFLALQRMASKPEYFYEAPDAGQLEGIYREIAVTIPCPPEAFWGRRP
jgi:RNA polymerase sigma factor (sigma-70 family)